MKTVLLLQLGLVATKLLRELRELAHPRAPVPVAVLLEGEDVVDAKAAENQLILFPV